MNQPQSAAPVPPKQPLVTPWLLIVFIIIFLTGGAYLGWYFWSQSQAKTETPVATITPPSTTPKTTTTTTTTATTNWQTITNTEYGYSLKYPMGWYVYGYKTGDETTTATLYIALKNAQADSHYIKVSTGNDTEMEVIITTAASKAGYETGTITLDGQTATQYSWTEVLEGKNISVNKLVKAVKGDYAYYLFGIVTDYNKTATIDQGNFDQILATFQFSP